MEDDALPSPLVRLKTALQAVESMNEHCCSQLMAIPADEAKGGEIDRLTLWLGCGFRLESAMRELEAIGGWFKLDRWRQSRFC